MGSSHLSWGHASGHARKQHIVYVISFGPELTKVGRTTNWRTRRKSLTHHDGFTATDEAVFHVDIDEDLNDVEQVVLAEVRESYRNVGGKEWFRASFDQVLFIVKSSLSRGKVEAEIVIGRESSDDGGPEMSEMTGDQLDEAIRRFALDHGIGHSKIIRWTGANKHVGVIQKTGLVPQETADRIKSLWDRPARLFDRPPA
jgi:hypothetical protein